MMGGGFGGCTINLIHEGFIEDFIAEAATAYKKKFQRDLTAFVVNPSEGTAIFRQKN